MAIVINGSGTVTGISVGGLPDGIVDAGTLATNSVDSAELIDGSIDTAHIAADQITSAILPAGSVLQVVSAIKTTETRTTSTSFVNSGLEATITPTATTSKIFIITYASTVSQETSTFNSAVGASFNISRDTTELLGSAGDMQHLNVGTGAAIQVNLATLGSMSFLDSPSTTSATTYRLRMKAASANDTIGISHNNSDSSIVLMEIGA